MNQKQIISLILCALTLTSLMVSCSSKDNAETTQAITTEPVETTEAEETAIPLDLPELDLGGFEMTVIRSGKYYETGIWSEELTGEPVDDAIFERNKEVEEEYNCKITVFNSAEAHCTNDVKQYVLAGDDLVDVAFDGGGYMSASLNNFYNLNELTYFDFSQPWWNEAFNEGVSIDNKLYFTIGAFSLASRGFIYTIYFNKAVAENHGINPGDYYAAAYDGTWDLDMFIEGCKAVTKDVDGDGDFDTADMWGFMGQSYSVWSTALGAGIRCAAKDENDIPYISMYSEKNMAILDKVYEAVCPEVALFVEHYKGVSDIWTEYSNVRYLDNKWLFMNSAVSDGYRNMNQDYGVLPQPKFDENQERYYHDAALTNSPVCAVPISCSDAELSSYLLEVLCYRSYYDVLPIYYENFLNTKIVRDEESVDMLQIIHNSLYYDIGALFNWGGMQGMVTGIVGAGGNKIASNWASIEKSVQASMENTLKSLGVDY